MWDIFYFYRLFHVCEEAIEKYLSQTLSLQEYHSWTNGAERSLLTDRPLSGCEFLLRQNQKTFPVWVKRKEIFSSIRENQVTMISGRVGDGRTSCVPQLCLQYRVVLLNVRFWCELAGFRVKRGLLSSFWGYSRLF